MRLTQVTNHTVFCMWTLGTAWTSTSRCKDCSNHPLLPSSYLGRPGFIHTIQSSRLSSLLFHTGKRLTKRIVNTWSTSHHQQWNYQCWTVKFSSPEIFSVFAFRMPTSLPVLEYFNCECMLLVDYVDGKWVDSHHQILTTCSQQWWIILLTLPR